MAKNNELQLAKEVVKEVKEQVTSAHDIISVFDLPYLDYSNLLLYKQKFPDRFSIYIQLIDFEQKIRKKNRISNIIDTLIQNKQPAPNSTVLLAVTMLGIGECSDTSNLATLLLCKKGCSSLINTLLLVGENPFGNDHLHALIVIGNCDGLTNIAKLK